MIAIERTVDDVCECGSPVEWFRPYPGKVNAVRSVGLWLCDRCGRIWTRHFSVYYTIHYSVNSDGEATAAVDRVRAECR